MDDLYSLEGLNKRIELEQQELNRYLKEVVHPILPLQTFEGSSMVGSNFMPRLHTSNKYFQNSKYYYSGNLKFIHYTSLNSFFNIINENCLRLSDFNSFDDPQEFVFAYSNFYTKSSISDQNLKSCFNSISFCEYDEFNNQDSFDMWRLYGYDGKGVAFIFSLDDDKSSWENYYLSKVYYGTNEIQTFKDLDNRHKAFFENSPITFNDHMFDKGKDRFPFQLFTILGFHKNSLYKIENEVRLLRTFNPFEVTVKPDQFYIVNKSNDPANFIKLNLKNRYDNKQEFLEEEKPKITIEKLILGYRFNENDLKKINDVVERISVYKSVQIIKTELSQLRIFFQ